MVTCTLSTEVVHPLPSGWKVTWTSDNILCVFALLSTSIYAGYEELYKRVARMVKWRISSVMVESSVSVCNSFVHAVEGAKQIQTTS
jgi:hypothetical protein